MPPKTKQKSQQRHPNGGDSTQEQRRRRRQQALEEAERTTLLRKPLKTLRLFAKCVWSGTTSTLLWALQHLGLVLASLMAALSAYFLLRFPPPSMEPLADQIKHKGGDVIYWTLLGILSSVGLGSGLHTFLLRLGPHIIMVANAAVMCRSIKFSAKISDYLTNEYEDDAFDCPEDLSAGAAGEDVSIWQILRKVAFPCFYWGLGTALGELPPYFVARAAQRSGRKLEELAEIETLESSDVQHNFQAVGNGRQKAVQQIKGKHHRNHHAANISAFDRAKMMVYDSIQYYGFWAVLLAASIPNPLFDLAGLTCGTFGIPFWTFFGATVIGKACIKVMIQAVFYATVFNPATLEALKENIRTLATKVVHLLNDFQSTFVASQYKTCWASHQKNSILRGEAALRAIQNSSAVQLEADRKHGTLAIPVEDLRRCHECCEKTFRTGVEACKEGCDDFLHSSSWLNLAWQAFIFAMIVWFFMSLIDNTVHDHLASKAVEGVGDDDDETTSSSSEAEVEYGAEVFSTVSTPRGRSTVRQESSVSSSRSRSVRKRKNK
eukprot:gb/GECG01000280.1/.p1 GENE.gb/GECG01000280.1/~~gb/GECG01000280.1/.p1  ORF type:complete len:549 (+),score=61.01 gb/GECG01000280.1/:1-1647(+)